MTYQVKLTVSRFMRAKSFLRDLAKLKAFRGEYVGLTLLENLEEHSLLQPKMRLKWPDPVARRVWLETHDYTDTLHDDVEPDGPRMDAVAELWTALQDAGLRSFRKGTHPFDEPKPAWQEFLQTPDQQVFVPHRERRVSVANAADPDLFDSENVQDFYSTWQVLAAAELADMGIHIRVNMADDTIAERVRKDIRSSSRLDPCCTYPWRSSPCIDN